MKLSPQFCLLGLAIGFSTGCGRLEVNKQSVAGIDQRVQSDEELEQYNLSLPIENKKIGSILVEKNISLQRLVAVPLGAPEPASASRCLLLAGSYLTQVKSSGPGAFSASVELPKKLALPAAKNNCKQGDLVATNAKEGFQGLAITASATSFASFTGPAIDIAKAPFGKCKVTPKRRNIRIAAGDRKSTEFKGSVIAASVVESDIGIAGECLVGAKLVVDSKSLENALSRDSVAPPSPIDSRPGTILVEQETSVELGDVPRPAIVPPPPAPRCILPVGAYLSSVRSLETGKFSASVSHAPTTKVMTGKNHCEDGRSVIIGAKDNFVGLAFAVADRSFSLLLAKIDTTGAPVKSCNLTQSRRNLRIKGIDSASGEFLASVVAAQTVEDTMWRSGECDIGDTLIADSIGIEKILTPGLCIGYPAVVDVLPGSTTASLPAAIAK
ncbi:MAG: hypothetical protein ACO3A4_14380 [Silvanigrellaceae bacterium]